ncbi:unnamed protein product [Staurois parvus]|uniref:Uncharacterized protein n=1 Tax=Staurois parvus TaxID=386267 RepID=A0ABN9F5F2_9NEOB|nr:unnamed protein product [Staurois parvus]
MHSPKKKLSSNTLQTEHVQLCLQAFVLSGDILGTVEEGSNILFTQCRRLTPQVPQ